MTLVSAFDLTSNSSLAHIIWSQAAIFFIVNQLLGVVLGAWLANAMFDLPAVEAGARLANLQAAPTNLAGRTPACRSQRRSDFHPAVSFLPISALASMYCTLGAP